MRTTTFAPNEHYHLYGRGVEKKIIFHDDYDRARFVFLILYFQSPTPINNIGWYARSYLKRGSFRISDDTVRKILKDRYIHLTSFILMPNHFHLTVQNMEDGAVSVYMHRVLTAYSKYFNAKYKQTGHLFQGPFGSVRVKKNEQLLHLSAYIHKNSNHLAEWKNNYAKYPWSSCSDYLGVNRWGKLLNTTLVEKQFSSKSAYKHFLETSTAKNLEEDSAPENMA